MNRKGIREIKKRFEPEMTNFSHIYGCYVNAAKEIVSRMDLPVMMMEKEEKEMYTQILRKSLSGRLGRNLINIEFATEDVGVSDEHKLLQALRLSHLKEEGMREVLYQRIIESLDMSETSYVILLAADSYDVPYKGSDEQKWDEGSTEIFDYMICCICPVKDSKSALQYLADEQSFRGISTGSILATPQVGFMFPSFDDRATNIYNALYYTRSASEIHEEFIEAIFKAPRVPMAAVSQANAFSTALSDALGQDCSLEVVRSVQNQIRETVALHKESHDPEEPEMYLDDVNRVLMNSGISSDKIADFDEACNKSFENNPVLNPENLITNRKFEINTPEAHIVIDPEYAHTIKTQIIDGRKYILIPVGDEVDANGIDIAIHE